ncbi:hypothetical protein QUG02_25075 [Bacillus hominis]|uniref:Glycerol-3-phosphate transporter n=1 Tax=Bacillus hominis TaxID=2817478 RepID=A0ABT7REJ4_9BACI|nr:hypothetical protein [Bacillus hominis]MDM5196219.1 hypothetical protein [Bacillus hominis]MDM5441327.1 hypothetical protein [Bacillus hominis]
MLIWLFIDHLGWNGCFLLLLAGGILSTIFLFIVQRGHERKGTKVA